MLAMSLFHEIEESKRVVEVITNKEHFGEWVRTHDVIGLDMRWEALAQKSESHLTFVLNSIEDMLSFNRVHAAIPQRSDVLAPSE